MQETKLADAEAPTDAFAKAGYALAHHGERRWNGVAIASRCGIEDVVRA
jgi:exodeoxyribonuclease-3